jgi:hypothetical protein
MNAILLFLILMFAGWSADSVREHEGPGTKSGVVPNFRKFCISNPKDSACHETEGKGK